MSSFVKEFKAFIMRGNVIDLAIGVIIGAAFGKVVDSIVNGLFMPIIGAITSQTDFTGAKVRVLNNEIAYGLVIQAGINFVIIAFCLFLVVKAMNKVMKKEEAKAAEPTESEKLLAEIRDLMKKRP